MTLEAKGLREKKYALGQKMLEITKTIGAEGRPFTEEERTSFDRMDSDFNDLRETVERMELAEQRAFESEAIQQQIQKQDAEIERKKDTATPTYDDQEMAFRAWSLQAAGAPSIRQEFVDAADKCKVALRGDTMSLKLLKRPPSLAELREQAKDLTFRATTAQTITTTGGGHTFTSTIVNRMEVALKEFGGMRSVATVLRSDSGEDLLVPTVDDTTRVSSVLAINTAAAVNSLVFGQVSLAVAKYSTGIILLPVELAQDTAVDLVAFIGEALGIRAARGTNAHFTTGSTTAGKPFGGITQGNDAVAATTGTVITYARMRNLEHALDPAYRANGTVMCHDNILRDIKKLVDSNGNPIFHPTLGPLAGGGQVMGYRTVINQNMVSDTTTKNARCLAIGDFSKYWIRDIRSFDLRVLSERYAELAQVAYVGFHRHAGRTIIATTNQNPIQVLLGEST